MVNFDYGTGIGDIARTGDIAAHAIKSQERKHLKIDRTAVRFLQSYGKRPTIQRRGRYCPPRLQWDGRLECDGC